MTDGNEATATIAPVEDPIARAAERGIQYVKMLAAELVEASRSAAQSVLDEQKEGAARQIAAVAGAARAAAQALEQSNSPTLAHYTGRAAESVERFGESLRQRSWGELVGEVEALARRRPALFIAGAVVAGFLSGRFLLASERRLAAAPKAPDGEKTAVASADDAVAAIASASGGQAVAEPAAGIAATQEGPQ
jgi:hypothetical protein